MPCAGLCYCQADDFFPGFGTWTTQLYTNHVEFGDRSFDMTFGVIARPFAFLNIQFPISTPSHLPKRQWMCKNRTARISRQGYNCRTRMTACFLTTRRIMLLRNQFRILISAYILTCASYCMAQESTWCEIKSPNFTIISNTSIRQARQVAKSLEQFRAVFQSALPTLRVDPGFPLIVFAVRDQLSFEALLPNDRQEKGTTQPAGVFLPFEGKNIVVLRTDVLGDQQYQVIYHEYVHMAMNLNFQSLPLWLFEGLAELYAFATY